MNVQTFENERWARDDQQISFRHREALALIMGIADGSNHTLLDIGCGDGLLLSLVKEKGIIAKGLDISEKGIEKARAKGLDVALYDADGSIPFPDDSFDVVVMLDVLEHVYDPRAVLREVARVARIQVIVSVPNFSSLPARLQTLCGEVPENNRPHKGHVYWFNDPVFRSVVDGAGLEIETVRMNTFSPFSKLGISPALWPNGLALSFVARLRKRIQ